MPLRPEVIRVPDIPQPLAHYTPAVRTGPWVFAAGQIASDYRTGVPPEARVDPAFPYYGSTIKRQTRYVLDNLARTFRAAGTSLEHCVKAHVFLTDLRHFDAFDEVWRECFPARPPCRAVVAMDELLVPGCLIEIDLIAALPSTPVEVVASGAPRDPAGGPDAIVAGDLVFAAGRMASDGTTGVPPEARTDPAFPYYGSDIERQTRHVLQQFAAALEAAGTSLDHIVKAHVFLRDLADFHGFDRVWTEFFPAPPPRTIVRTPDLLVRDARVAIDLVAARPSARREPIRVPDIPRPLANDAPARRVGDLVFAAGALATDFRTGVPPEARLHPAFPYYGSAIKRQTRYVLENLARTFRAAGSDLDRVVKAQVYLTDLADFSAFDEVWKEFFPTPPPRTTVRTPGLLVRDCLVEVDLIAAAGD